MEALEEPACMIVDAVHSVLEKTPPELAADIPHGFDISIPAPIAAAIGSSIK